MNYHLTLFLEVIARLLLAMCIGGGVGWERARSHHPAGMRTHMLVTIGAAIVMLLGSQTTGEFAGTANSDPARLGAQVISGIGFLGAGTIMKEGRSIRGLTTAATLWVSACLGLAIGAGQYIVSLGGFFVAMLTLRLFKFPHVYKRQTLVYMHKKFFINTAYRQNIQSGIDKLLAVTYNKPVKSTIQLFEKKGKGLMVSGQYALIFIAGFFLYIGLMILIAYLTSRKGTTKGEDYLMGGRNVGLLLLICTAAATAVGTGTSVGATANGFRDGWLGAVYPLANAIGLVTVAFCFSHVRKYKFRTLCEELQFYYDGSPYMRKFMSVVIFVVSIVWVGSAINGGANYLAYLIGMDIIPAKIITVFAFGVYVFVGGYMAVVWTDAIQAVLLFGGFVMIAILAIPAAGGFETIKAAYEAAGNPGAMTAFGLGSKGVLGVLAVALASYYGAMAGPTAHMRVYTAKSPQTARKAILIAALVVGCFSVLPAIVGMSGFTIATGMGMEMCIRDRSSDFSS